MSGDTMPETPTEGGRVYRALSVDQLKTYATDASSGYAVTNEFRKSVENNLTDQARSNLVAGQVHAVGFEVEVDLNSGTGPPPFVGFQGAIGVSVVWLVGATDDADVGPHVYAFANQGENGVTAIGDAPDFSEQIEGCFFATYFGGDRADLTPAAWEEALGTVGVDAGGGRGLLSGEVILYSTSDSMFVWNQRDVWYTFVADLAVTNGGTTVSVTESNYVFYEWLLGQLGILQADDDSSWDVPEHDFWEVLGGLVPDWGGSSDTGGTDAGRTTCGEDEVRFPSGECLPIVDGPDAEYDGPNAGEAKYELLSERYWDPQGSGTELLDTSGDHWGKKLSEDILVADLAQSGSRSKTFDKARIAPELVRFLQAYLDELNERSDEGVLLDITSGYRSWWYNRETDDWPAELPAADVSSIERDETGNYKWEITLEDGSVVHGNDVSKSEHCAGRGVDLHIESTSCTVSSSAAYLRDDEDHEAITGDLPDGSPLAGHDDVRQDGEHWELVDGVDVTVTDRGVGPDGQIVVEVEIDGTVIGWTNWANLDSTRNPGFDAWDLGKIALATPDERDVGGVSPCDTRLGIEHAGNQWIHVDIKPRADASRRDGGWFPYWFYTGDPWKGTGDTKTRCDSFRKKRVVVDINNDCGPLPDRDKVMRVFYTTNQVYEVETNAAYLRDPNHGYASYTEDDPPDNRNWDDISEVVRHTDGTHWKIVDGTEVTLTDEATGPEGQSVVKAETNETNPTVLGWTNLANLVFK